MSRYQSFVSHLIVPSLATAALLAVGCGPDKKQVNAPPPQPQSQAPVSSAAQGAAAANAPTLAAFKSSLVEGEKQIDTTLASLTALTDPNQQDLRGAYDTYCDNLARMNSEAETTKIQADAMRSSRDTYFGQWEEKTTEIDNPTIRASAEARRKRLRDANEAITTQSNAAKDAYVPFMKDLQDIKKYLANDLSKNSIADIGDAVKKVQVDGANVKSKIDAVIKTLDSVQGGG